MLHMIFFFDSEKKPQNPAKNFWAFDDDDLHKTAPPFFKINGVRAELPAAECQDDQEYCGQECNQLPGAEKGKQYSRTEGRADPGKSGVAAIVTPFSHFVPPASAF